MGLSYDTALLTGAELVEQTSTTDLANLETTAELELDDLALNAQREVYERLFQNGLTEAQLAAMTNESWLKRHIADLAVARIEEVHMRDLEAADRRRERALHGVDRFKPTYPTATATSRASAEGIPSVGHASAGFVYGPAAGETTRTDYMHTDLPTDLG